MYLMRLFKVSVQDENHFSTVSFDYDSGLSHVRSNNFFDFSDVMEYEPDADMIFNYLMVSALAAATDFIEKEGLKPTGGG